MNAPFAFSSGIAGAASAAPLSFPGSGFSRFAVGTSVCRDALICAPLRGAAFCLFSLASRRLSSRRRPGALFKQPHGGLFSDLAPPLRHARSSRGIPAVFHSPQASESLSLVWPRESNQREGHPTLAPYAQSLCFGSASLLRGSPTVHPWTGVELAHIVWAILRTFPSQSRRDRGGPGSAHRARQSNSQSQSPPHPRNVPLLRHALRAGSAVRSGILPLQSAPSPAGGEGKAGCGSVSESASACACASASASALLRRMRSDWGPYAAAKWWRNCPQGGSQGCEPVGCQCRDALSANPGTASRSRRAGCPETAASGWPFSWLLLFGHSKRSDSLAGRRVKSRHGCRARNERALNKCALKKQSPQIPESAGMAIVGRRANPRQKGRRAGQSQ